MLKLRPSQHWRIVWSLLLLWLCLIWPYHLLFKQMHQVKVLVLSSCNKADQLLISVKPLDPEMQLCQLMIRRSFSYLWILEEMAPLLSWFPILLLIKTDQQSLKYITEQKVSEGIQHKLMWKLLEFNYKIEYKKKRKQGCRCFEQKRFSYDGSHCSYSCLGFNCRNQLH